MTTTLARRITGLLSKTVANGATRPEADSARSKALSMIRSRSRAWAEEFQPLRELYIVTLAGERAYSDLTPLSAKMRRIAIAAKREGGGGLFSRSPETLNGKPFDSTAELFDGEKAGPVYPRLPQLDKWRKLAASGKETLEDARAYGRAVGDAIRALNGNSIRSAFGPVSMTSTAETDARCRARIQREFWAAVAQDRRNRTDDQIIAAYHAAMAAKAASPVAVEETAQKPVKAASKARRRA